MSKATVSKLSAPRKKRTTKEGIMVLKSGSAGFRVPTRLGLDGCGY